MVTMVIFCLAIFVGNLNVPCFWNLSLLAGPPDLFQALTTFFFLSFPCASSVLCQCSRCWVEGKKKGNPVCEALVAFLACWCLTAEPEICRTHYRWLAENHWSLMGELRNPKGLCWTWAWWAEIPDLALSQSSALQCFSWTIPMLFTWDRSYFACFGDFQAILNNIFSELAFGSAVFE